MVNVEFNPDEFKKVSSALSQYVAGVKTLRKLGQAIKLLEGFDKPQKENAYAYIQCDLLQACDLPYNIDLGYDEILWLYRNKFNKLSIEMDALYTKLSKANKAVED